MTEPRTGDVPPVDVQDPERSFAGGRAGARLPSRYIVGIDLGTTHTVVAFADTAELAQDESPPVHPFPLPQLSAPGEIAARDMLPSVRYHPADGELPEGDLRLPWGRDEVTPGVVGELALALGAKVPGRLVASAKSWLSHGSVDRTARILPWGAVPEVFKVSPVEASASYLRHVVSAWSTAHPEHPLERQQVVLTVPASFDEAARALTLAAARAAGLARLRLVEEPQAAFYDWLDRHRDALEEQLASTRLALVVDVGGGTTDLTLIRVELREGGPRLTRIAVGDHLMLGGDNMDLALARRAEERIAGDAQLGTAAFHQLIQQCRRAKERLLDAGAPERVRVTVLGSGRKLIGGARSTEVGRDEVRALVLDGFFPVTGPGEVPTGRRGALVEFGLPFVSDPAVTRHVAAFLSHHAQLARLALGDAAPAEGALAVPDAVLFNGGVFRSEALAGRMLAVLGAWRGEAPRLLVNDAPELAVARGAVAYGLARRGMGLRIGGGSARSYFLVVKGEGTGSREGVCLLPRGAEEGEAVELTERTFSLRLGRPVRFPLVSSAQDVRYHRPGAVVDVGGEAYLTLPPLAAVLEDGAVHGASSAARAEVPVHLVTALTEVGTLEMSCVCADDPTRRWKLELSLRGESKPELDTRRVRQLHPRFAEATERLRRVYGKRAGDVRSSMVKTLRVDLEKIIGGRASWDTPLLRELFGALLAGLKRRRRSAAHERVWFNLTGYALRPGFGYPLDEWRVEQLWGLFAQGVQFMPEAQNQAEWWILWRRVAGGLTARMQGEVFDAIEWYLHPPTQRPRPRATGPRWTPHDDMVRLAGALERVPAARKAKVGSWLVQRLSRHGDNPQRWWSVGRMGARVPFHGSAHEVVARDTVEGWLSACLELDWGGVEQAAFAATLLARVSGDRERDLDPALRAAVGARLDAVGAPASWRRMVREVTHLGADDERRVFGDSLPPGLRLMD